MRRTTRRWQRAIRSLAWPCLALLVVLIAAPGAAAHAELQGTTPANETTIEDHPDEVTLSFTEDVKVAFGAVKAYGPDGSRADRGEARADGDTVTVPIDAADEGTYALSWRAISADGHPIRGAFVFHVGSKSTDSVSLDEALQASEGSRAKDVAFGILRAGYLLGILAAVGAIAFAVLVAPGWRPRWLVPSLLLAIASMVGAYVLDASIAAGLSLVDAVDPDILREQGTTVYGRGTLVRIALALACLGVAVVVVRRGRLGTAAARLGVIVVFAALASSLALTGHAVGDDASLLRLPFDMVHSVAAAAWLGGLLQLWWYARSGAIDPIAVGRFSRLALGSVGVLVLTGLYAAWQEVGVSLDGLLDTTYGRLVAAKSALLVATLPLANVNRTRNVRDIAAAPDDAAAARGLRRFVAAELVLLVLVVAATAWLVQAIPAKVSLRPALVEQTRDLGSGGTAQLIVDPAAVGGNEVHVYVFDGELQPDDQVTELTLTATLDERGLGPLDIPLDLAGPGHYSSDSATIPFAGTWELSASIRRGEFDEERSRFSVEVQPGTQEN